MFKREGLALPDHSLVDHGMPKQISGKNSGDNKHIFLFSETRAIFLVDYGNGRGAYDYNELPFLRRVSIPRHSREDAEPIVPETTVLLFGWVCRVRHCKENSQRRTGVGGSRPERKGPAVDGRASRCDFRTG
jgi:hypothetical protein